MHSQRPEKGIGPPGVGVTGSCRLTWVDAGNQGAKPGPLQEQLVLLTVEPSPCVLSFILLPRSRCSQS